MKIAIATDHNGVEQKKIIIDQLTSKGYEVIDKSPINNPEDDYPDFAFSVAKAVVNKECDYGILMCGTGIGMSIAANKVKGIRCAHVSNVDEARHTREDNNANMLALSYKNDINLILSIIDTFLQTEFLNAERHVRRLAKISLYEETHER